MEHAGVGTALARRRRDRQATGDAPGHWPRHDLLPRLGECDSQSAHHAVDGGAHEHWSKPKLAELPSHYIRRQIHATFQQDAVAIHNIPLTGADCLLWGNDYPHPESTYPNSNKVLDALLKDVADDDARAVVFDNARRLFGFSESVREAVA